jgi:hypothetical protein
MSASSPQLDSEKLSRYIWFEVDDGTYVVSCMFCYTDDVFFRGEPGELEESNWLTAAAKHVLDKHP